MAFTFLKAQGCFNVGKSLCETDMSIRPENHGQSQSPKRAVFLPVDTVIAQEPSADAERKYCCCRATFRFCRMGLDIGPASIAAFSDAVKTAKTIVWNGPLGMFELALFPQNI